MVRMIDAAAADDDKMLVCSFAVAVAVGLVVV
jgi:hypothetical protein